MALGAWYLLSTCYKTGQISQVVMSLCCCLEKAIPDQAKAAGFGNKIWETRAKDIFTLFLPFLKDTLSSWRHPSSFLGYTFLHFYTPNVIWSQSPEDMAYYLNRAFLGDDFYILQMVCSSGKFQGKTDDTILLLTALQVQHRDYMSGFGFSAFNFHIGLKYL